MGDGETCQSGATRVTQRRLVMFVMDCWEAWVVPMQTLDLKESRTQVALGLAKALD